MKRKIKVFMRDGTIYRLSCHLFEVQEGDRLLVLYDVDGNAEGLTSIAAFRDWSHYLEIGGKDKPLQTTGDKNENQP